MLSISATRILFYRRRIQWNFIEIFRKFDDG